MSGSVIWLLGDKATAAALSELLEGFTLVPVKMVDPLWPVPRETRPVGVLIAVGDRSVEETARLVDAVHRRCPLTVLLLTDRALALEASHALLKAGATGLMRNPLSPALSDSARGRAQARFKRQLQGLSAPGPGRPIRRDGLPELVAIGSSTGGPQVLREILIGAPFKVPVLISQHIRAGYAGELARWLCDCGASTRLAVDGDLPTPGQALLAPGDRDMVLADGRIQLLPAQAMAVPSVDRLFSSVASSLGSRAAGILLTGMGQDGARGLLSLRHAGAFTVAQTAESCVVNGMPQAGRDLEAAWESWSPRQIRHYLDALRQGATSTAA